MRVAPKFHRKHLEKIFQHKVFKVFICLRWLLSKGKPTQDLVNIGQEPSAFEQLIKKTWERKW